MATQTYHTQRPLDSITPFIVFKTYQRTKYEEIFVTSDFHLFWAYVYFAKTLGFEQSKIPQAHFEIDLGFELVEIRDDSFIVADEKLTQ